MPVQDAQRAKPAPSEPVSFNVYDSLDQLVVVSNAKPHTHLTYGRDHRPCICGIVPSRVLRSVHLQEQFEPFVGRWQYSFYRISGSVFPSGIMIPGTWHGRGDDIDCCSRHCRCDCFWRSIFLESNCFALSSSARRSELRPRPARFMKYVSIRMPEPGPFGETLFEAKVFAIVMALLANNPGGG